MDELFPEPANIATPLEPLKGNTTAAAIQRPRSVRVSTNAKINIWVFGLMGGGFLSAMTWVLFRERSLPWWIYASWVLLLGLIAGLIVARFKRDRYLAEQGESVLARVTSQSFIRFKSTMSKVNYEFVALDGITYKGYIDDESKLLFPGMEVEVLYDPSKPKRHVVLATSIYEPFDPTAPFEVIG